MPFYRAGARVAAAAAIFAVAAAAQAPPKSPSKAAPQRKSRSFGDMTVPYIHITKVTPTQSSDPNAQDVDVEVVSTADKTITAFSVSLLTKHKTGMRRTSGSVDLLERTLFPEPGAPAKMAPDGTGYIRLLAGPDSQGNPPETIRAEVSAVIFDDHTSIGEPAAIAHILEGRRVAARECAATLKDIQGAEAEPQVVAAFAGRDPNATAELKKALLRRMTYPTPPRSRHDEELYHFIESMQAGMSFFDVQVTRYKRLVEALQGTGAAAGR